MEDARPATGPRPATIALIGAAQGAVYAFLAYEAYGRWPITGVLLGVAAAAQAIGAGMARERRARVVAGGVSLAVVALLVGLHVHAMVLVLRAFDPVGTGDVWEALGGVALALPWVAAVPVWQIGRAPQIGAAAAALVAIPFLTALASGRADRVFAEVDGPAVASWAWERVTASPGPPPSGPGPVKIVVTLVRGGVMGDHQVLEGSDLAAALDTLALRTQSRSDRAVIVEVAVAEGPIAGSWLIGPKAVLARPGEDGLVAGDQVTGARAAWLGPTVVVRPGPVLSLPGLPRGEATRWVRLDGWMASDAGVVHLRQGWAAPPPLDADEVRDAALAGAHMLVGNQRDDGRFAYVVAGPTGKIKGGYNYPRHAGAAWFLALAAQRDPSLRPATTKALGWLRLHTTVEGDMAWVLDPERTDHHVWVGTTALALLALIEAEGPSEEAARYGAFLAASVDARGAVMGDYDLPTASFPPQPEVTYAQGQVLLALAVAAHAGVPGVDEALARAAHWSDTGYRPGDALYSLDDHWGCLAALAVDDALGRPAGLAACDTWLAVLGALPNGDAPLEPSAGGAGAMAEAAIARAFLARRAGQVSPWEDVAKAYGRVFLAQQYRPADAPLLGHPDRLVGGFRDRPWALDVRVDSVQHIGCALFGLERLLRPESASAPFP